VEGEYEMIVPIKYGPLESNFKNKLLRVWQCEVGVMVHVD
jgi:hypothetical protein